MDYMQSKKGRKPKDKRYNSKFAAVLRSLLSVKEKKGVNLTAVADELGITRQSLAQYRDGNNIPDIVVLGRMADYFNVTTDYLLGRTEIKTQNLNQQVACKLTGLSDEAVQYLHKLNDTSGDEASDVVSQILTYPIFHLAITDILKSIDYCRKNLIESNLPDNEKKVVCESVELLEQYGYELREPLDEAYSNAMQAYEAFKYIIDNVISNISGHGGSVLRHNDMAFDMFADMYGKERGDD